MVSDCPSSCSLLTCCIYMKLKVKRKGPGTECHNRMARPRLNGRAQGLSATIEWRDQG